ncbi:MAG: hypothetical protein U0103_16935 [Candidatus Obscuribacterales bacterium]|nr:hypothetical protein [Cyanobacteria bacterium SZAS LIN-5]
MLVSRKGDSRQGVYLLVFMLILLITEVVGIKYAGVGIAVSGMAIEATGAFAASKSNQQIGLAFLCGALIGLVGSVIGTMLCLKFAFPPVATMSGITMLVLFVAFEVGARFEKA